MHYPGRCEQHIFQSTFKISAYLRFLTLEGLHRKRAKLKRLLEKIAEDYMFQLADNLIGYFLELKLLL